MLETINIVIDGVIEIDDAELKSFLSHLSKLKTLTVRTDKGMPPEEAQVTPKLTLGAFAIVASLCPSIEAIDLTIDARTDKLPLSIPTSRHPRL